MENRKWRQEPSSSRAINRPHGVRMRPPRYAAATARRTWEKPASVHYTPTLEEERLQKPSSLLDASLPSPLVQSALIAHPFPLPFPCPDALAARYTRRLASPQHRGVSWRSVHPSQPGRPRAPLKDNPPPPMKEMRTARQKAWRNGASHGKALQANDFGCAKPLRQGVFWRNQ